LGYRILLLPGAEEEGDWLARTLTEAGVSAEIRLLETREELSKAIRGGKVLLALRAIHDPTQSGQLPRRGDSASPFQALVKGGLDAFFVFSSVREKGGRIANFELFDLNVRGEKLLGRSRDELLAARLLDILPGVSPMFLEKCLRVAETGEVLEEESSFSSQTPKATWLQLQVVRVGDGIGIAARDIGERKRLERQLLHAQKMEAVGRLAGGIAHDFNNLLTTVLGYGELMLMQLPDASPLRPDVEEILKAGQRAVGLTRQLLAFSRRQVVEPKIVDLNALIEEAVTMLRRLIGEDIDLVTRLEPELGTVRVDPGQMDQILMNLAVNSRDAMPRGGRLGLETRNVTFDASASRLHFDAPPGSYALLAVTDNGVGMDEKTRAHVFEPFFTTKEIGKGTGLGLATVYGIVKQSGGYIFVYSEPGKGTTFKIYLPRADTASSDPAAALPASTRVGGSETILLVEDEEAVRRLMEQSLKARGYRVLEAASTKAALALAGAHAGAIDLLITDVVLTGVSGRDLATALLSKRPEMKVLFVSGYTEDTVVQHGVLTAAEAFLPKPFTPDTLTRKVREILDAGPQGAAR
jgi:signal transduction histidine kinase/CheY-like chemotaxis protein